MKKILVNGCPLEAQVETLADVIGWTGAESEAVATAVNGQFVPRASRAAFGISDGMSIEILSPMQGG